MRSHFRRARTVIYVLRAIGEDSGVAEMIFCEVEIASRNGFDRLMPYIDVLQRHKPLLTVLQHER